MALLAAGGAEEAHARYGELLALNAEVIGICRVRGDGNIGRRRRDEGETLRQFDLGRIEGPSAVAREFEAKLVKIELVARAIGERRRQRNSVFVEPVGGAIPGAVADQRIRIGDEAVVARVADDVRRRKRLTARHVEAGVDAVADFLSFGPSRRGHVEGVTGIRLNGGERRLNGAGAGAAVR